MNSEEYNPLDLKATLDRMEPGVAPVPVELALASIAVSLKVVADNTAKINSSLQALGAGTFATPYTPQLNDISNSITAMGNNLIPIASGLQMLNQTLSTVEMTIRGKQP